MKTDSAGLVPGSDQHHKSPDAPRYHQPSLLRAAVGAIPGVDEVEVTLVWDPPWNVGRMSEAARLQLGML